MIRDREAIRRDCEREARRIADTFAPPVLPALPAEVQTMNREQLEESVRSYKTALSSMLAKVQSAEVRAAIEECSRSKREMEARLSELRNEALHQWKRY